MPILLRRHVRAEPTTLSVQCGGERVAIDIRRSPAARRLTLRVSGTSGRIMLTVPTATRLSSAQRFADSHAEWLATRLAARPASLPFVPGSLVPIRDVPHLILHATAGRGSPRVARHADGTPLLLVWGDPSALAGRVRRFLYAEAERDLRAAVGAYAARLGTPARRITVRDTRSRWGSCSSAGTLNFSWRLIMAPPLVLDYLAAHEVAHLTELNHSDRFWTLLRGVCPETDAAERWLKRHGAGLHRRG